MKEGAPIPAPKYKLVSRRDSVREVGKNLMPDDQEHFWQYNGQFRVSHDIMLVSEYGRVEAIVSEGSEKLLIEYVDSVGGEIEL